MNNRLQPKPIIHFEAPNQTSKGIRVGCYPFFYNVNLKKYENNNFWVLDGSLIKKFENNNVWNSEYTNFNMLLKCNSEFIDENQYIWSNNLFPEMSFKGALFINKHPKVQDIFEKIEVITTAQAHKTYNYLNPQYLEEMPIRLNQKIDMILNNPESTLKHDLPIEIICKKYVNHLIICYCLKILPPTLEDIFYIETPSNNIKLYCINSFSDKAPPRKSSKEPKIKDFLDTITIKPMLRRCRFRKQCLLYINSNKKHITEFIKCLPNYIIKSKNGLLFKEHLLNLITKN